MLGILQNSSFFEYFCAVESSKWQKMILIADSGSTKTDWVVFNPSVQDPMFNVQSSIISTQGLNPVHQTSETILRILRDELLPQLNIPITAVYFYGSGVRPELESLMVSVLHEIFLQAETVEAHSDMLGAARALCGHNEGIASILGTGANSCLYDGYGIRRNTPAMGYILGDEGSGASLGKRLIHDLYKGVLSKEIANTFECETSLTLPDLIDKVYRQPLPNRFLASLSTFIHNHLDDPSIRHMVVACFSDFFAYNIVPYGRPDLPVNFVGSIAFYYQDELREAAKRQGFHLGSVLRSPLEGLVRYHQG